MLKILDDRPVTTGDLASAFGIASRNARTVLSVTGRRSALPPGLFPETNLVSARAPSDASLVLPGLPVRAGSKPVLKLAGGFLRTPPVRGRPAAFTSATLSRGMPGRTVSWADSVARGDWYTPALAGRAEAVLQHVRSAKLGSAWWAPAPRHLRRAVVFAAADAAETLRLLEAAIAHFGAGATTLVSHHRSIGAQAKRIGVAVLRAATNPWDLVEAADRVFASVHSEAALLAQLLAKDAEPRPGFSDPARLAAATLLLGTRYVDPFTGAPARCETYLDIVDDIRRKQSRGAAIACCVGISFWKRARVAAMLGPGRPPAFRKTARAAVAVATRRCGAIAVWPSRAPADLSALARAADRPVVQLEDGFIRSVGIGAEFRPPLSLVLDELGLYYDATRPSNLERLLSHTVFTSALIRRAADLRTRMVREGVTKYNLPPSTPIDVPRTGRVILVPGQVADDRSVLLGGVGIGAGLDLLGRVRQQAPDAFILYKPHPDVDAGHRLGAVPDTEILRLADRIVRGGSMADLLAAVDEVHTLTSLTGFEALLRGKPVTSYGQPFYAGWGLTTDLHPPARRTRTLLLDELVAGALILYPHYHDPVTLLACGPETVLDRLRDPALHRPTLLIRARRAQGRLLDYLRATRHDRSWKPAI